MNNMMVMHHLGIAVKSLTTAIDSYKEMFGYDLLSGPFHDPIQEVSVCFIGPLDATSSIAIELVEPASRNSPINKFLSKEVGAYHICYETDNILDTLTHLRSKHCIIIQEPVPAVAFNMRQIAWLYTPTRQLVELLQK
jgi:methylmalonyl-CoA/ethylmalonyl-CoA epimerase